MKMKKRSTKYEEIWARVARSKGFAREVAALRVEFGLDGKNPGMKKQLHDSRDHGAWEGAIGMTVLDLMPHDLQLEEKFIEEALETYITGGKDAVNDFIEQSDGIPDIIALPGWTLAPSIGSIIEKDKLFIEIPPHVAKKAFLKGVSKDWGRIKEYYDEHFPAAKTIKYLRGTKNRARDALVYKLYRMSRQKLGLKRGELKEVRVSTILKSTHGIDIEPENIKVIVSRQQKLKR